MTNIHITIQIDKDVVSIPVGREVKAYFNEQFVRPAPSQLQQKRYSTLINLMRAAYKKGREDSR